jgi:Zn-dependent peptidase ImmA (M78 family)
VTGRKVAFGALAKQAIEFRVKNGIGFDEPCDIYELIAHSGIDLQFVDVPSLEGMYLDEPESRRICVCAHRPVGRQRYTAAHELGHSYLGHGTQIDTTVDDVSQLASSTSAEAAADAFARYLLMPAPAVQTAFRGRGFEVNSLEPIAVYRAACWLGVGYQTLLNQMAYSLNMLPSSQHKRLSKVTPRTIKAQMAVTSNACDVWPLDQLWANRTLHAQIGDVITGINPSTDNPMVTEMRQELYTAKSVGIAVFPLAVHGTVRVCISRGAYVGFYDYRYLPE